LQAFYRACNGAPELQSGALKMTAGIFIAGDDGLEPPFTKNGFEPFFHSSAEKKVVPAVFITLYFLLL